jgi:hypothetical protein
VQHYFAAFTALLPKTKQLNTIGRPGITVKNSIDPIAPSTGRSQSARAMMVVREITASFADQRMLNQRY